MNTRYHLEAATPDDDPALRALLRENAMGQRFRVAFEREPDFFAASRVQGEFYRIGIARDTTTNTIAGLGTRAVSAGFLNGKPAPLGYLGDLRLSRAQRGGTLLARGYRLLREWHRDARTHLYTTVIFGDNTTALTTIAAGRAELPRYHDCGAAHCPGVLLRRRKPAIDAGCETIRGNDALLPEILACLNRHNARRQFAPQHRAEFFAPGGRWRDFRVSDFYVARRDGRVIGVVGKWDQRAFKQTRIVGYRGALRWLAATPLRRAFGLPRAGECLPFFHACFVAIDDDDLRVFRSLLRCLYNEATGGAFTYIIIGFHERDPLRAALEDYALMPFHARLFAVSFADGDPLLHTLDARVPHIEPALL
jgi:hypothetical protein